MTERVRLSLMDAMFLRAETRETPMHVGGLQIFRVPPGAPPHFVSELMTRLRAFPAAVPPLNYGLTGGPLGKVLPSWEVLDEVDLDYHVRHSALPHPGGARELGVLVSRLHSNPMDLSRPLWEFHLIEGLAERRFAIYCKLHHALVDGAGSLRLLNLSTSRAHSDIAPFWADESRQEAKAAPGSESLLGRLPSMIEEEVKAVPSLVRGLATTAGAALGVGADPDLASIAEAPRTILNVRIGAERRVATHAASLQRIKAIGHAAGGTVNDVVLAACSAALRRYLDERGELPEESLIAAVPMALHHEAGAASGNAVTCLNARLGTNLTDVRERFELIRRSSAAGKAQLKDMTQTAAMHFVTILSVPVLLTAWLPDASEWMKPPTNLIISNVPGPRERLYFHGAEMVEYYPVSQVGHNMALNITVLSYADGLYFGFVACPDSVPSVQQLAVHVGAALDELEKTFVVRKKTPATRKRRGRR